ncbi:hypothetical protein AB834_07155 [PVC group bacterium (ex Bugula neritina AB1)]|nr:hypothetical protein AB834_07155 [PVC group bacterium (ex Bugula neritina AB1)]
MQRFLFVSKDKNTNFIIFEKKDRDWGVLETHKYNINNADDVLDMFNRYGDRFVKDFHRYQNELENISSR